MADPSRSYDTRDARGIPRWVKVVGLVVIVAVLVMLILMLVGGGEHGPGRHNPGRHQPSPGAEPSASSVWQGHTPPAGGHS
jgi:hypothetical protein